MSNHRMTERQEMAFSYYRERPGECIHYQVVVERCTAVWKLDHDGVVPDFGRMIRKFADPARGLLDRCDEDGKYRYPGPNVSG